MTTICGGRVLASTHGVQVFHPNPNDYWRWTQTGLRRVFEVNADWSSVDVEPGAGTAAGLAMLIARFLHLLAKRAHMAAAARPFVAALNAGAGALDARVPMLREPVPGAGRPPHRVGVEPAGEVGPNPVDHRPVLLRHRDI